MFNKKVDKLIAGTLVTTNILGVSVANAVNDEKREVQEEIFYSSKSYDDCDLVEYYDSYENAIKRLEFLTKYCNVLDSEIIEGNFDVVKSYTDKYVVDGDRNKMLENTKNAIINNGGEVIDYKFDSGIVKEVVSTKNILSDSKTFSAKTESEVLNKSKDFINSLEKEYDEDNYDINVDVKSNPIYLVEPERVNVSKTFDSEDEAINYINDMESKGYSVSYDINMVDVDVKGDTEYVYAYDRDTAHGLLFDKDQAEVYLIAHRRVRPDLTSQGYVLTDVSFERVRRWDTWTYDIVYTYSKPIVKTDTVVKYNLDATFSKGGVINGYESCVTYDIDEIEYEEVLKELLTITSEFEENIDGFKLEVKLLLDEFLNNRNGQIDKDIPKHDINYYFKKLEEIIPKPDTEDEKEKLENEINNDYDKKTPPKTGDDRNIELYLFLCGLSSIGLIATGKKKEDELKKKLK